MENLVAYLGPTGSFTQQAAGVLCPDSAVLKPLFKPLSYIEDVFQSVEKEKYSAGVVPIENSTEGAVNETLDSLLREENVVITKMLTLPIRHCLMVAEKGIQFTEITKILAHPQALAQCRNYIRRYIPQAQLEACSSNGEAAAQVAGSAINPWASIGSIAAAEEYGLHVYDESIQDQKSNRTAFIKIEKIKENKQKLASQPNLKKGRYTSIVFSTENRAGALCEMLNKFEKINLTKILSRPMKESPGAYVFFVDLESDTESKNGTEDVEKALKQVQETALLYRYLGTYEIVHADERG